MHKLLPVVALTVLVPTAAWATVTEVQNTDDPTRHPYQETVFQGPTCDGVSTCYMSFPTITTGTTLVQHVSCYFQVNTGGTVLNAQILDNEGDSVFEPITLNGTSGGVGNYITNTDAYLFLRKGDALLAAVVVTGEVIQNLECTATGYYL